MSKEHWPSWRYGPNGEAQVFDSAAEVPDGWQDHPSKHEAASPPKKAGKPAEPAPLDL